MARLRTVTVKVPEELIELIEELAKRRGATKSEIVRRAIIRYLEEAPDMRIYRSRRLKIY